MLPTPRTSLQHYRRMFLCAMVEPFPPAPTWMDREQMLQKRMHKKRRLRCEGEVFLGDGWHVLCKRPYQQARHSEPFHGVHRRGLCRRRRLHRKGLSVKIMQNTVVEWACTAIARSSFLHSALAYDRTVVFARCSGTHIMGQIMVSTRTSQHFNAITRVTPAERTPIVP